MEEEQLEIIYKYFFESLEQNIMLCEKLGELIESQMSCSDFSGGKNIFYIDIVNQYLRNAYEKSRFIKVNSEYIEKIKKGEIIDLSDYNFYRKNLEENDTYYVDLSVSATVEGVEGATNITEVKAPMDVTIDLPDDMRKKGRKFHVVRHHKKDGKHETHKLDCHMSNDGGKIHFKTDRFSTYAIVYEDESVAELPHSHTPGEWVVTKEATGKETGLKELKCKKSIY